jgi:transposase
MALLAVDCPGCRQRDLEIARLQRILDKVQNEILQLRQQLQEARNQEHRQAGRFRCRLTKKRRKKPGRRKGHRADLRPTPTPEEVDRVIDVPCPECPDCHAPLYGQAIVTQYQTDLPPIVPIVTQFNIETGYCQGCGKSCQGRHAEQTSNAIGAAGNTLGPVVLTMAAELKHRLGVPYRKICDFFSTYCDLEICPATFVRAEQRLARLARPTYDLLIDALRRCGVVHIDETGWRVNTLNAWLWVFTNKDITIYTIRTGAGARGHEVPAEILGPDFEGTIVVDGLKTYDVLGYTKGQCNAHLLRRCKDLVETTPTEEHHILQTLTRLLLKAIALAERRPQLTAKRYARRVQRLEDRFDACLVKIVRRRHNSPELERLFDHIMNHYDEWLLFLHDSEVPPTNNQAERMLRPAVITRKVGGCNKTLLGALVHSILSSIMVTCHQQGKRFLDIARRLWQAGEPQAIPLLPGPDG